MRPYPKFSTQQVFCSIFRLASLDHLQGRLHITYGMQFIPSEHFAVSYRLPRPPGAELEESLHVGTPWALSGQNSKD